MIENIPPCSRKKERCFCTFNDFNTFAQLSFHSLHKFPPLFRNHAFPKRPFFSCANFPARKAAIIFFCKCVLLCAVQDAQCNTEESIRIRKLLLLPIRGFSKRKIKANVYHVRVLLRFRWDPLDSHK